MKAIIHITLKNGVLDPQGKAISHALKDMGFDEVEKARQGKIIELELSDGTKDERLTDMCEKLLANPVIEDYKIDIAS
jgi:phosphoribosylformylglycinamidine synthase